MERVLGIPTGEKMNTPSQTLKGYTRNGKIDTDIICLGEEYVILEGDLSIYVNFKTKTEKNDTIKMLRSMLCRKGK